MSEEQRYKKIAELLLGRLITLQREFNNVAEVIEESCEKHQISMYIEIGDFIPLMELADSLVLSDENDESKIYYLVEKEKDSDSKVEKFFKKYIKNN